MGDIVKIGDVYRDKHGNLLKVTGHYVLNFGGQINYAVLNDKLEVPFSHLKNYVKIQDIWKNAK